MVNLPVAESPVTSSASASTSNFKRPPDVILLLPLSMFPNPLVMLPLSNAPTVTILLPPTLFTSSFNLNNSLHISGFFNL